MQLTMFKKTIKEQVEVWKNARGYSGLYQVSNLGNIRSINYNHTKK